MLGRDSDVASVGPKCLEDRGECVLVVQPVSPLITEIKLAKNCINSGKQDLTVSGFPFPHSTILLASLHLTTYLDTCSLGLNDCPSALCY